MTITAELLFNHLVSKNVNITKDRNIIGMEQGSWAMFSFAGCYDHKRDKIYIIKDLDFPGAIQIIIHELVHYSGAAHRLNRDTIVNHTYMTSKTEEAIANLTSLLILYKLKILPDTSELNLLDKFMEEYKCRKTSHDVLTESLKAFDYVMINYLNDLLDNKKTEYVRECTFVWGTPYDVDQVVNSAEIMANYINEKKEKKPTLEERIVPKSKPWIPEMWTGRKKFGGGKF